MWRECVGDVYIGSVWEMCKECVGNVEGVCGRCGRSV